jgi:hypothetical protein
VLVAWASKSINEFDLEPPLFSAKVVSIEKAMLESFCRKQYHCHTRLAASVDLYSSPTPWAKFEKASLFLKDSRRQ